MKKNTNIYSKTDGKLKKKGNNAPVNFMPNLCKINGIGIY